MWFLQLSTFHAVSIIYDHVIKFFCLKSLLVNQLWTVWNCPLFQNDVPFDQPWDDTLNVEMMMSSWVIKIEKFKGETTKLTIFTIKNDDLDDKILIFKLLNLRIHAGTGLSVYLHDI